MQAQSSRSPGCTWTLCQQFHCSHMPQPRLLRRTPTVHQEPGKTQASLIQPARDQLHLYMVHLTQHGMMMACLKRWPDVWYGEPCQFYQDQLSIQTDDNSSLSQETKSHIW